jgi:2-polyprenyl-3-methyl-5-hydroxy-6-metoxy-1,4-benzoquinol methylase
MQSKEHWERVYTTKATDAVSWFQEHANQSLAHIRDAGVPRDSGIIDVGGGASTLVDDLVDEGYSPVTVLDLSESALGAAKGRLGEAASRVSWLAGDITRVALPQHAYGVWHDRAVFHFLTEPDDRAAYVRAVLHTVRPGGLVMVATFAEDGPTQCSGLPVVRYSPEGLHDQFGTPFTLLKHVRDDHRTPFGTVQKFIYCLCRKEPS